MKTYEFTLILDGVYENTPNLEDAIFEAGCDDALINFRNGTVYIDFIRENTSLNNAIISAINQIEGMNLNARVISVAPENLVTESDIARRLNMKKQAVSLWIKGLRRKTKPFPRPVMKLSDTSPLWRWHEVVDWSLQNDIIKDPDILEQAIFIENLNFALEERNLPILHLKKGLLKQLSQH
jgi:hypothetical protein